MTAREIHVRDEVASSDPLVEPCTCQIPKYLKPANFEKQLREIDKAIMGEMSVLENSIAEGGMLNFLDELQSREQRIRVNEERDRRENNLENGLGLKVDLGLTSEFSGQDNSNPQKLNLDQAHETMDYLFVMGPQASKAQWDNNIRKEKGPTHKRVKWDVTMWERKITHKKGGETPIDVDAKAIGGKRKERIPLEEILADEVFGKK